MKKAVIVGIIVVVVAAVAGGVYFASSKSKVTDSTKPAVVTNNDKNKTDQVKGDTVDKNIITPELKDNTAKPVEVSNNAPEKVAQNNTNTGQAVSTNSTQKQNTQSNNNSNNNNNNSNVHQSGNQNQSEQSTNNNTVANNTSNVVTNSTEASNRVMSYYADKYPMLNTSSWSTDVSKMTMDGKSGYLVKVYNYMNNHSNNIAWDFILPDGTLYSVGTDDNSLTKIN